MVKGYEQKTDEDGERGEKEEAAGGGETRVGGRKKRWKKARRKAWLRRRRDGTGLGVGRREVRVWRGGWRQGRGSTGCFIMQKLSRQLGRSGSAPLHQHRVGGGGGGGGGGIQVGGGGLEKASAPESRKYRQPFCDKLFFGWSAPRAHATPRAPPPPPPPSPSPSPPRQTAAANTRARMHARARTRWKSLDTLSKKGESRGGRAPPRYSTPAEAADGSFR